MADVVTDERVAAVLRPFVRATTPVLRTLRESDPFGLRKRLLAGARGGGMTRSRGLARAAVPALNRMEVPGSAAWDRMDTSQRTRWWVNRVGRFVALLAAVPGLAGALSDRLPVRNALGAAGQGLVLCALADERDCHDEATRVRLLAVVLFGRDLSPEVAAGHTEAASAARDRDRAAEMLGDLANDDEAPDGNDPARRPGLKAAAGTVWRMGRALWAINDELDKRPQGRLHHRAIGLLPVAGMLGDYLGERSALRRTARRGVKWLNHPGTRSG